VDGSEAVARPNCTAGDFVQRELRALRQMLHVEEVGEAMVGIPIELLRRRLPLSILEGAPKAESFAD